jgi:type IV secretory pathway protease TraF
MRRSVRKRIVAVTIGVAAVGVAALAVDGSAAAGAVTASNSSPHVKYYDIPGDVHPGTHAGFIWEQQHNQVLL